MAQSPVMSSIRSRLTKSAAPDGSGRCSYFRRCLNAESVLRLFQQLIDTARVAVKEGTHTKVMFLNLHLDTPQLVRRLSG